MLTKEGSEVPNLPDGWLLISTALDGYACQYRHLRVIVSANKEKDGRRWWHISISRRGGWLPSWADLKFVKDCFIGPDKSALIVLPRQSEYVNLNEVHHLWHCIDGDVTPDFTGGTGSI